MISNTRFLKKLVAVLMLGSLIAAFFSSSAWGLPPKLEAKKNWLGVEKALEKDDYVKAIEFLEKLKSLEVELQPEYYFHYGRSLIKTGKFEKGLEYLNRYIEKAGEEGEYVEWALELMNEAEGPLAAEKKRQEELEIERQKQAEIEKLRLEELKRKEDIHKENERRQQEAEAKKLQEKNKILAIESAFAKLAEEDLSANATDSERRLIAWTNFVNSNPLDNPRVREAGERLGYWSHMMEVPYKGEVPSGMVVIPAGPFQMGYSSESVTGQPVHKVLLDRFFIDKYEVTQVQYEKEKGTNPSAFKGDNLPVENVTWHEAVAYCSKLGKRLPTEAEWEKAARAGTTTKFYWGENEGDADDYAWTNENAGGFFSSSQTHPVGQKKPNAYGLYDTTGNVWEWVSDLWGMASQVPSFNPKGPSTGSEGMLKGGSWVHSPQTSTIRLFDKLDDQSLANGFRCAASAP